MTTMNASNAARRSVRTICVGLACAMALSSIVVTSAPTTACAKPASTKTAVVKAQTNRRNGQSVSVKTGSRDIDAEWYQVGGTWWATFRTDNGTLVRARQSGKSWKLYAAKGKSLKPIVATDYESSKDHQVGPKNKSSHFKAKDANIWY